MFANANCLYDNPDSRSHTPAHSIQFRRVKAAEQRMRVDCSRPSSLSQHLDAQYPTRATVAEKVGHAIWASAMVDAIEEPNEIPWTLHIPTNSRHEHDRQQRFLSLPPGVWTDYRSMTLWFTHSLFKFTPLKPSGSLGSEKGRLDEEDQLRAHAAWYEPYPVLILLRYTTINALGIYCTRWR